MEVAGVLLGAIPIVVAALEYSKDVSRVKRPFSNRRSMVRRLIEALEMHEGELQMILEWLLQAIDEEPSPDMELVSALLQRPNVQDSIRDYLGTGGARSFDLALEQAQRAIKVISRNIRGFLADAKGAAQDDLTLLRQIHQSDTGFKFDKSCKLLLRVEEVEDNIRQLKESTKALGRLQSMAAMRQIEATVPSKKSTKLVKSLTRIRTHACHLYEAILSSFASGCHATHEARLILEDRIDARATLQRTLDFNLVFTSEYKATTDVLWYRGQIEVIDIDHDSAIPGLHSTTKSPPSSLNRPTVTFSPPPSDALHTSAKEVIDICVTVARAKREQKPLKWYLMAQRRLHCCPTSPIIHSHADLPFVRTVTLASLLHASEAIADKDRARKLPLMPRISLALTLASTLVQLNATPWLGGIWSKDSIGFLVATPSRATSAGQELCQDIDPAQINLKQPLITETFAAASPASPAPPQPEPRRLILELGIMFLELLRETTFESFTAASGQGVQRSHQGRRALAQQWLEESEVHFTIRWFGIVARCVQCSFDNVGANPSWNEALFKGFVQGVIEPLQEECR